MSSFSAPFCGVVLAGGRSLRMGRDKALIELDGELLWKRQYKLLAHAGATERFLSLRPDQTWAPPEIGRVVDPEPDLGPLSGLAAALAATAQRHIFALAVDMPCIPLAWCDRLRKRIQPGRGAVGQLPGGAYEPLAGFYPAEILPLVRSSLRERRLALQSLVQLALDAGLMAVEPIRPEELDWFQNLNEPAQISAQP